MSENLIENGQQGHTVQLQAGKCLALLFITSVFSLLTVDRYVKLPIAREMARPLLYLLSHLYKYNKHYFVYELLSSISCSYSWLYKPKSLVLYDAMVLRIQFVMEIWFKSISSDLKLYNLFTSKLIWFEFIVTTCHFAHMIFQTLSVYVTVCLCGSLAFMAYVLDYYGSDFDETFWSVVT